MSLSNAVLCFSHPLTVIREKTGFYVEGRYQETPPEEVAIKASVQPVSGQDRMMLPEGIRSKEIVKIYTTYLLKTASAEGSIKADVVIYNGCRYDVTMVQDWTVDGGFYKAFAARSGR